MPVQIKAPSQEAMRAAIDVCSVRYDGHNMTTGEWLAQVAAIIDRETRLPELLKEAKREKQRADNWEATDAARAAEWIKLCEDERRVHEAAEHQLLQQRKELLEALEAFVEEFAEWEGGEEPEISDGAVARNRSVRVYQKAEAAIRKAREGK